MERLRAAARGLRAELEAAANEAGERALRNLRDRLAQELRRARIGRIDAVMGSKRQVELQMESLAAGRFPPELVDPLHMQSLLARRRGVLALRGRGLARRVRGALWRGGAAMKRAVRLLLCLALLAPATGRAAPADHKGKASSGACRGAARQQRLSTSTI